MPFYFRIPLPGPFGYTKRIGRRRRQPARQPAVPERPPEVKMTARKLRKLSPRTLAYSMAASSMTADDRAWVREVYGDFPEGCGWHWDTVSSIPRSDTGGEWWTFDTPREE